jgi:hypothetical protein
MPALADRSASCGEPARIAVEARRREDRAAMMSP